MASLRWIGHRAADFARGFVDTFLRENKLLPPVLALLALFVFAWVLAGVFLRESDDQKPVAHRSEIAQTDGAQNTIFVGPEIDNPNLDSYAAYRSKDPFRQIFAFAETTQEETTSAPAEQTTTGSGRPNGDRPAGGGNGRPRDSDGDGLSDRMEATQALDPNNPDTDGDGIPDGLDDVDGDGVPDGASGASGGAAADRADKGSGGGDRGAGGRQGRGGDLLDSGGKLSPP